MALIFYYRIVLHFKCKLTQWKKEAKDKINKMKKNKLTEDEVYKWLVENK